MWQSAPKWRKTIGDLVEFHSIIGSWYFNESSLKIDDDGDEVEVVGASSEGENVEAGGMDSDEVEVVDVDVEEIELVGIGGSNEAIGGVEGVSDVESDNVFTRSNPAVPSSPAVSDLADSEFSAVSDASSEPINNVVNDFEGAGRWPTSKRKRPDEPSAVLQPRWKVPRKLEVEELSDGESAAGTDDNRKRGRSATASRRLKELARSEGFVVDEGKKRTFEGKCVDLDVGARFHYQGARWRVMHSKCLSWLWMSEPYNATKFRKHVQTCKARGEKPNSSITSFFKPMDQDEAAEAKPRAIISGRKQIFVSSHTSISSSAKPPPAGGEATMKSQPCRGISDDHDPRVSTYISRAVVEGAGSISIPKATKVVYGDNIKYSELSDSQKEVVTLAQAHLRTWIINRERQVVFSTKCTKFVEQGQPPDAICHECNTVLRSEAFKWALRVKPAPLDRMKFIPIKYRGPLEDLGAKFAGIKGLSDLLQDVSHIFYCASTNADLPAAGSPDLNVDTICLWRHQGRIQ